MDKEISKMYYNLIKEIVPDWRVAPSTVDDWYCRADMNGHSIAFDFRIEYLDCSC